MLRMRVFWLEVSIRSRRWDQRIANVVFATQLVAVLVRNWVIAIATERVTSPQTAHREPAAFEGAMLFQGFQSIGRTGWLIAAIEANPWAENQSVSPHWYSDDMGEDIHGLVCSFCKAVESSACMAEKLVVAVTLARPIKT